MMLSCRALAVKSVNASACVVALLAHRVHRHSFRGKAPVQRNRKPANRVQG